jgi:hypothetical protein
MYLPLGLKGVSLLYHMTNVLDASVEEILLSKSPAEELKCFIVITLMPLF